MRVALALLVLAGCGSDTPGMRLDIGAGGTGATTVEIYLGRAKCSDCKSIQPVGARGKLDGDAYFLDGSAAAGTPETAAAMEDGHAVFELRAPAATDVSMPVIVVLGLDADGTVVAAEKLTDVPISAGSTVWWKVDLKPAIAQTATEDLAPKGRRVQVWRRHDVKAAACVDYEFSDGSSKPDRTWLVPEDDTDCDDVPAATECDPYAFLASGTASLDTAHCVTDADPVPDTPGTTCLLGGDGCVDGAPQNTAGGCARVDPYYCVPDILCTDGACRASPEQCLLNPAKMVTQVGCDYPVDVVTGAPCPNNATAAVQLDSFLIHPANTSQQVKCHDVQFADVSLARPTISATITRMGAVLHRDNLLPQQTCAFPMTLIANAELSGGGERVIPTFADLELTNDNHILLPFVFTLHPADCTMADAPHCTVHPAQVETLRNCSQP